MNHRRHCTSVSIFRALSRAIVGIAIEAGFNNLGVKFGSKYQQEPGFSHAIGYAAEFA